VDVEIHVLFTSALAGGQWSVSLSCFFTPRGRGHSIHWIGGCVAPEPVRMIMEILDPTRTRNLTLGRPVRSQSLYRLRYIGSYVHIRAGFMARIFNTHTHTRTHAHTYTLTNYGSYIQAIHTNYFSRLSQFSSYKFPC
jgi:hypothetical protein